MPVPDWLRNRRESGTSADDASLWQKCPKCSEMLYQKDLVASLWVCSRCGYHFRMHAYDRVNTLVDGDFVEIGTEILPGDPLGWTDKRPYPQKLERDRDKSKLSEAVVTGFATLDGFPVALGVMDFNFRGGTMGTVVGERITNLLEEARRRRLPCCSPDAAPSAAVMWTWTMSPRIATRARAADTLTGPLASFSSSTSAATVAPTSPPTSPSAIGSELS